MDYQQNPGGNGDHVYGEAGAPTPAQPQAQLIPMGEGWAPGVGGVPVEPRSRRLRWGIALGFVAIVAIVGTAGAFVLSGAGGAGQSLTAAYAPKDTLLFTVLRTDLPGDQHQKLADFMSHFPGFGGDRALFDTAIDTELNHLISSVSPDLTYTSGFKPWMQGEISIAATSVGSVGTGSFGTSIGGGGSVQSVVTPAVPPDVVAMVALKDTTAAQTFVSSEVTKLGRTFTSSTYAGATVYTTGTGTSSASYAFIDNVLLLGTPAGVKASLDAKTKGALTSDANYKAAMKSLSGDSIATYYVAASALIKAELAAMPAGTSTTDMSLLVDNLPAWDAGQVRAESDHLVVEMTLPSPAGAAAPGNHVSVLASRVPASTIALVELHSIGAMATSGLDKLSAQSVPVDLRNQMNTLKTVVAGLGGLDWLLDGAAVVTKSGSTYAGGVVVQVSDAKTANDKVALVRTLLGTSGGSSTSDEAYKGVTITTLGSSGGAAVGIGGAGAFAFAVKDDLIIAGSSVAFVKSVIDTTADNSLASSDAYKTALAAAGASNAAAAYVDIASVSAAIGAQLPAGTSGYFTANVKPYLDHVGGAAFAEIDGSTITIRFIVMAK